MLAQDFRGGAGAAGTTIDVAQAPPPGLQRPALKLAKRGSGGRVRFTVTCDSACAGRATLTISRKLAKRLRLGRQRVIGSRAIAMTAAGTKLLSVRLTTRTRHAMKRAGLRRINAKLTVKVTDAEHQARTARATVNIRR